MLHLLCIGPQHFETLKHNISKDPYYKAGLERVFDIVGDNEGPQETGGDVYSLKPEFYDDYNPYHYHYNHQEQLASEFSVKKIHQSRNEENCCPPPVPVPLDPALHGLLGLMNCDITMHLIHQVFLRTSNPFSCTFSEGQLKAALYLTGLALVEEEACHRNKSRPPFEFSVKAQNRYQLLSVLDSLQANVRVDVHRPLLMWAIRKFRSVHSAAQAYN